MGLINYSNISDGTTIDASDVNNPFNTIYNEFNGNIEGSNIKNATITQEKLANFVDSSWSSIASTNPVTSVTANGNRSYDVAFTSSLATSVSPGMRIRTTRTVAAPTQCTSLNGTTQYYSKSSPAGMTFTDDFVVTAWIKLSSYPASGQAVCIASRYNGSSGWVLQIADNGRLKLGGFNGSGANYSEVASYQSIPLNKWVHVATQLDMSTFTASTTTSYVMIDGIDVPAVVSRGGTNPTALVQAGNLEIGSYNSGNALFPGKIAQVAIYSAKVTQANIKATISQGLSGSETSLISAYSFNNSINDLNTTNANNLTANGSAVATNADSPFGCQADGTISSTLDYGIVMKVATSTLTVQVPEGCTIPTTGGVTSVAYSSVKAPYGFPAHADISYTVLVQTTQSSITSSTDLLGATITINVPANAKLEFNYRSNLSSTVAGDVGSIRLVEDSTNLHQTYSVFRNANNQENPLGYFIWYPTAGLHTYKLIASRDLGTGTLSNSASTGNPTLFAVKIANF